MTLIRTSNELELPRTIKMLVYGQAGMGKSTLALSAPKPLLLDFDGGVKRINNAHLQGVGIVQINSWIEATQVLNEDLSAFETIVIDTIGKMMDYIIDFKCKGNIPRINDWSGINQEFSTFVRNLSNLNKNIIFVGHRDTRKEGEDTVFIPALREKNYNAIVTELDLLGYVEAKDRARTITFDPTSRNDGKNTCNLPPVMNIPTIIDNTGKATTNNTFFTDSVIKPYLARLDAKQADIEAYNKLIEELKIDIELITDAISAQDFASRIDKYTHIGNSMAIARRLFADKLTALNLKYNKDTKAYEQAA
ncbi:ATP-binding protein [Dysgonomonas termitidis]|uniref:ATP-binding protein n=1 Tax=Dysgonomonas termitidis TaxID=1516126 RepID=A0ABV9L165_9BACT